ncbi:MAG: electron transfer flavoprotein beta subunit/FixA family protein [Bacteroidetes bacterium]|uniref:Electron transfer flavoprotein subunit beta n=1 Tax=Phaeocystidibacter marisrubri TaxID=1577780 RepID=A0A6L3ZGH9_9FLAO|nr:electron transfer flavoprotein subunit beta/FixA family protein [Phaeocystidibacter marisrubri]KAB2816049.1 electron transfer flavoprotein subunit beta/FixA family protein [Phaeocystidibacter marisrubri]TNE30672.1 MAG: electron transfer flavoprotein beta subunit/FixA family protein [Bacteroidota bacterium]GGH67080.1 electron transfer flavoprotein subunit alpha [Phaeocystidibacter marisrubri]
MKILVCISHVPDTTSKINFVNDNTEFDTNGVQFIINPYDEFGLTKAIQLKEANGGTVTAINVGDATTEPTLRKALAIGADDAIRVNANPTDAYFVAEQLAAVAKDGGYDLIICGQESIDYNGGQVGGMLAALLDLPFASPCVGLDIDGSTATVLREIDGGKEKSTMSLPIVLGGKKGLVEEKDLRIPNMRGIMTARTKPLATVEAVSADARTTAVKFEKPAAKAAVKLVDSAEELVQLLHNEAKAI